MTTQTKKLEVTLIIRIISTLPLMLLWFLVYEKIPSFVVFWNYLGIDITKKYDLFLFADNTQYIRWYVHYTAYYYTLIILASCLVTLSKKFLSKIAQNVTFCFYLFCIIRLMEYWLFRFHLGFGLLIAGIILYSLSILSKKWLRY